jgi:hypothetical protein
LFYFINKVRQKGRGWPEAFAMRRVFLVFIKDKNDKKAFTMIRLFRYTLKITFGVLGTPETLKVLGVFFGVRKRRRNYGEEDLRWQHFVQGNRR